MRSFRFTFALVLVIVSLRAHAQNLSQDPTQFEPRYTVAGGYEFLHTNAPPGISDHFSRTAALFR